MEKIFLTQLLNNSALGRIYKIGKKFSLKVNTEVPIFFRFGHQCIFYRFSYKDFGKAPYQNYPQTYISTLRTNFDMGT